MFSYINILICSVYSCSIVQFHRPKHASELFSLHLPTMNLVIKFMIPTLETPTTQEPTDDTEAVEEFT